MSNHAIRITEDNFDEIPERVRAWIGVEKIDASGRKKLWMVPNPEALAEFEKRQKDALRRFLESGEGDIDQVSTYNTRYVFAMGRGYICNLLRQGTTLQPWQFPDELIELKRAHIQLIRAIRTKSKP